MTRSFSLLVGAAVIAAALSGPTFSQDTSQTVTLLKLDPASLVTGYCTSKAVGSGQPRRQHQFEICDDKQG
jgi:hypothetical protein